MTTRLARTVTRTATALAALATIGAVTAMATPATAASTTHLIDSDWIRVAHSTGGFYGVSTELLRDGTVQATLPAKVKIYSGTPGCLFARAVYTYADGSTTKQVTPRACKGELTTREAGLASSTSKNLVKYAFELLKATDSTATGTVIATRSYFVGDAPGSYGTKERLDHDTTNAVREGVTVFRGSADYSITKTDVSAMSIWSVRSHVVGDLTWADTLVGSSAFAKVRWTYADGSFDIAWTGTLYRDNAPIHMDVISNKYKDVVSTQVFVCTSYNCDSGGAVSPISKFGDYSGS